MLPSTPISINVLTQLQDIHKNSDISLQESYVDTKYLNPANTSIFIKCGLDQ